MNSIDIQRAIQFLRSATITYARREGTGVTVFVTWPSRAACPQDLQVVVVLADFLDQVIGPEVLARLGLSSERRSETTYLLGSKDMFPSKIIAEATIEGIITFQEIQDAASLFLARSTAKGGQA